jgi:dienelactone hydrolase
MDTLIISDIFGRTDALIRLAAELSKDALIFDPYDAVMMDFDNEQNAYSFFSENIGVNTYAIKLAQYISKFTSPVRLIGFSAGASAIWNIAGEGTSKYIKTAFCYYGSQIRQNTEVNPVFPVNLIAPASEEHFSVDKLIERVSGKAHVRVRQVPFLHGFMNEQSANFHLAGYQQELRLLRNNF